MSTYKEDIVDTLDYIKDDISTVVGELETIVDKYYESIDQMRIDVAQALETARTIEKEF